MPPRGQQQVLWSAAIQDQTDAHGDRVITVAVQTTRELLYLAVPVHRTRFLVVSRYPALVGPPVSDPGPAPDEERDVSDGALRAVAQRAVTNYLAASEPTCSPTSTPPPSSRPRGRSSTCARCARSRRRPTTAIPHGLCQCGCGQPTNLAPKTSRRNGDTGSSPVIMPPYGRSGAAHADGSATNQARAACGAKGGRLHHVHRVSPPSGPMVGAGAPRFWARPPVLVRGWCRRWCRPRWG